MICLKTLNPTIKKLVVQDVMVYLRIVYCSLVQAMPTRLNISLIKKKMKIKSVLLRII